MTDSKLWCAAILSALFLSGCVTSPMPKIFGATEADQPPPMGLNSAEARPSSDLMNYRAEGGGKPMGDDLVATAVKNAGQRLGATAGYRAQAEALYDAIAPYDEYLSKIFDFQELMLPHGIVPPVLAQTEDVVSYSQGSGQATKEIRARVLSTVRDARFANPKAPSWRDYLRMQTPPLDKPHPQLQEEIDKNRAAWRQGVELGYARGIERATQAFEISINELSRDYVGMQLFRLLWASGQAEPPKIIEQDQDVVGGGRGNREMSTGVRRIVITEPVYFVNDTAEWDAIISTAFEDSRAQTAGLMDIIDRTDTTQHTQAPSMEPNLNAR